jgi:hypothetical protein
VIKLLPLSIVIVSIVLPIALSSSPSPKRALRNLRVTMAVASLFWALLCLYVYPRYVVAE